MLTSVRQEVTVARVTAETLSEVTDVSVEQAWSWGWMGGAVLLGVSGLT